MKYWENVIAFMAAWFIISLFWWGVRSFVVLEFVNPIDTFGRVSIIAVGLVIALAASE